MSYSFQLTCSTKDEVVQKVQEEMDRVVAGQPRHAADTGPTKTLVKSFLDTLSDPPEGQAFRIDVTGSIGWRDDTSLTHVFTSVNIYHTVVKKDLSSG